MERWLPHLGVTGHGDDWLVSLFERIGSSADDVNFLGPGTDDVWAFLDRVAAWASDPNRKGIP